jgi:hypothetical protein
MDLLGNHCQARHLAYRPQTFCWAIVEWHTQQQEPESPDKPISNHNTLHLQSVKSGDIFFFQDEHRTSTMLEKEVQSIATQAALWTPKARVFLRRSFTEGKQKLDIANDRNSRLWLNLTENGKKADTTPFT